MRLLVITDIDFSFSGYFNIAINTLTKLAERGYDIKVLGLSYKGQEHNYPFSIIPLRTIYDGVQAARNLHTLWNPNLVMVMLDIPLQRYYFNSMPEYQKRYIALTPMENGPLTMSWAADLMQMKGVLFISQLGMDEAHKAGVRRAEHIQIGIDTNEWRVPSTEERKNIRKGLGFDEDTFILLTVADNQERKNLWAALSITAGLKKLTGKKIRHVMVTRDNPDTGYNLEDMALSLGIMQEFVKFKRGMPQRDLWALYAMSDVFLLTSKAEGLGMPVLEAMSSGLPVVATDTGALHELLINGRGFLIPADYEFIDVWGNSKRSMVSVGDAVGVLQTIMDDPKDAWECSLAARQYVEGRTWDIAVETMDKTLRRVHGQEAQAA